VTVNGSFSCVPVNPQNVVLKYTELILNWFSTVSRVYLS